LQKNSFLLHHKNLNIIKILMNFFLLFQLNIY